MRKIVSYEIVDPYDKDTYFKFYNKHPMAHTPNDNYCLICKHSRYIHVLYNVDSENRGVEGLSKE